MKREVLLLGSLVKKLFVVVWINVRSTLRVGDSFRCLALASPRRCES
jgi:hypothetical protein